jgi:hypothetical protein
MRAAMGEVSSIFSAPEWSAHKAILMHAVNRGRAGGRIWMGWLLAAFALGSAVSVGRAWPLTVGVGVPLGMLSLRWWIQWFTGIVIQCNPIAMHLAPHMRARARRVTIAVWVAIVIVMTVAIGVPTGYPGHVAVFTGLALMEISAMFNVWRIVALIAANWLLFHSGPEVAGWYADFLKSSAALAIGVLLVVLDGRVALHRMFGRPRRLPVAIAVRQAQGQDGIPVAIARLLPFVQVLAGEDTRGQPLVAGVLGANQYIGEKLVLVLLIALCVVMRTWVALSGNADPHAELFNPRYWVLIGPLMLQQLVAFGVAGRIAKNISEQALVRLAPNAPASSDFNRVLARYFLRRFAQMWSVLSASTLGALWILGATPGELARALAVCSFTLVLSAVPLADFARRRAENRWPTVLLSGILFTSALASAIAAVSGGGSLAQWAIAAVACIVAAAVLTWYRWRAMVAAPPAYPAGRLG